MINFFCSFIATVIKLAPLMQDLEVQSEVIHGEHSSLSSLTPPIFCTIILILVLRFSTAMARKLAVDVR